MAEDITDTDRINAIEAGYCVTAQDEHTPCGYVRIWSAAFNPDRIWYGGSMREAIDQAILACRQAVH